MGKGITRKGYVGNTCGFVMSLSQVLVTARISIVLEIIKPVAKAVSGGQAKVAPDQDLDLHLQLEVRSMLI